MRQRKRRLTKEQEELRLSGLRILARLIALRCLADQQPDTAWNPTPDATGAQARRMSTCGVWRKRREAER